MECYMGISFKFNFLSMKYSYFYIILFGSCGCFLIQSCIKDFLLPDSNTIEFKSHLSEYDIYQGFQGNIIPQSQFHLYEVSTQLFSDYAEKQRLIYVPIGDKLSANGDGLPDFPDGTILVKTFFYYKDKRDTSMGKKIIETRLLIKENNNWNVATYLWNEEQTDASIITAGLNKTVNWIDDNGNANLISFKIPGNRACAGCHSNDNIINPLGLKMRNLNFPVFRNSNYINQLDYLQNLNILNSTNTNNFSSLPNAFDTTQSIIERARAYLDINCAHCHNDKGLADFSDLYMEYELTFNETHIQDKKSKIIKKMEEGQMPVIGITTVDKNGLELIKKFIESL